jgi:ubiquinone/menaquinone biosynthesis C-methylase UbiE
MGGTHMFRTSRREVQVVIGLAMLMGVAGGRVAAQSAVARQQDMSREAWQKVSEIFSAMGVVPGAMVADVGAGDGFLTERLARAVGPDGRVFAVDVEERAIERLRGRVQQEALTNVTVVKGDPSDPRLAAGSLDAAVIVNAYHEMTEHQAMLQQLRAALKPGGRLVIVEPISDKRLADTREDQTKQHEIAARFVEQEARDAGFRIQLLQDPFTSRGPVREWLIVAVTGPGATTHSTAPVAALPPAVDENAEASPDLRMAFETFKQRRAEGSIAVVDVRSEDEYLEGHIPGALWIELSDLSAHLEQLKSLQRPIVTYCS